MHILRGHIGNPAVAMFRVVPVEEWPAEGPGVLQGTEALGKLGAGAVSVLAQGVHGAAAGRDCGGLRKSVTVVIEKKSCRSHIVKPRGSYTAYEKRTRLPSFIPYGK